MLQLLLGSKRRVVTRRTFVVLGCPRGGTSLVAGALSLSGVSMCSHRNATGQFEDPDFKIAPGQYRKARKILAPFIDERNATLEYWGWKLPNNVYYINQVRDLLVNPIYLFIYRDVEAIARSSAKHDGRGWSEEGARLLEVARKHTWRVKEFEASVTEEKHVFALEDIHPNPQDFVSRIVDIVQPLSPDPESLIRFVNPGGGYFNRA